MNEFFGKFEKRPPNYKPEQELSKEQKDSKTQ